MHLLTGEKRKRVLQEYTQRPCWEVIETENRILNGKDNRLQLKRANLNRAARAWERLTVMSLIVSSVFMSCGLSGLL